MLKKTKPKVTGKKIRGTEAEKLLIGWLIEDPEVSNLELSRRLQTRKIRIASATIQAWRANFYNADVVDIQIFKQQLLDEKEAYRDFRRKLVSRSTGTIDFYLETIKDIENRVAELRRAQETFQKKYPHRGVHSTLEELIISYYKLLDQYRARLFKFTGGGEYLQKLEAVAKLTAIEAVNVLFPFIPDDKKEIAKKQFESSIKLVEQKIYDGSIDEDSKI